MGDGGVEGRATSHTNTAQDCYFIYVTFYLLNLL